MLHSYETDWNLLTRLQGMRWVSLWSVPKKQYDKNVSRTHYNVGDTVWYLINRIKWVRDKVMKPLPSYKGPYVIQTQAVQLQDDSRQQLGVHTRGSVATYRGLAPDLDAGLQDSDLDLPNLFMDEQNSDNGSEKEADFASDTTYFVSGSATPDGV